jgi:HTH-type transcriptional regulator/antitoxin HigA
MAKKMIRPIRSETEYDGALDEIERYFENEPKPGTPEADRFDFLALIVFGWTGVLDLRIV